MNREFSLERDLSKYTRDNWGARKWKMNMFGAGVKTPTKPPKKRIPKKPRSSHKMSDKILFQSDSQSPLKKDKKNVHFGYDFDEDDYEDEKAKLIGLDWQATPVF